MRFAPLAGCLAFSLLLGGCYNNFDLNPFPSIPEDLQAVEVESGYRGTILILDVDGEITEGGDTSFFPLGGTTGSTVVDVAQKLEKARKEKDLRAIVLRVDSPGGSVTASDLVLKELRDFKEEEGVPVYVAMMGICASGGYYISMAGDEIYALPTTWTGSIGVRLGDMFQVSELGDRIGVDVITITAGRNKGIGSPFHDMTEEQREILQSMVDSAYEQFLDVIQSGRPELERDALREIADGRVYTAQQAKDLGLVDEVLYLEDVLDRVREKTNSPKAKVVMYRRTNQESFDTAYAKAPGITAQASTSASALPVMPGLLSIDAGALARPGAARAYYVWNGR